MKDYQRASLFHTYIAERIGPQFAGSITRGTSGFSTAYNQALGSAGFSLSDMIKEYHIANFVNSTDISDGRFGYNDIRRRNTRVNFATFTFFPGQTEGSGNRTLQYGGADYIEWIGAGNMSLTVSGSQGVEFAVVTYPFDLSGLPEIDYVTAGSTVQLTGEYERVILISTANNITSGSDANPPDYSYTFDSSWETLPIIIQNITHAGPAAFFAELPGTPGLPEREGIREYAKRFSPQFDANLKDIFFNVNGRDSSLIGNDALRIVLAEGVNINNQFIPDVRLDSLEVPFSNIIRGENRVSLNGLNWNLTAGKQYFIIFRVTSNDSRIEFLLDEGSEQTGNSNYFPPRSFAYLTPPTRPQAGWFSYQNNNNLLATIRISGEYNGPITEPQISVQPVGGSVKLDEQFTLAVIASGTPAPIFQWYKNGEPLYGADSDRYIIESMTEDNQGEYTVLVSNAGGFLFSEPVTLTTEFEDFALEPNYPNPFSNNTTFEFVTPIEINVTIDVFDVSGRLVETVIQNKIYAAGRHFIEYPQSGSVRLASGVYLYRLRGVSSQERYEKTGKMLIIK